MSSSRTSLMDRTSAFLMTVCLQCFGRHSYTHKQSCDDSCNFIHEHLALRIHSLNTVNCEKSWAAVNTISIQYFRWVTLPCTRSSRALFRAACNRRCRDRGCLFLYSARPSQNISSWSCNRDPCHSLPQQAPSILSYRRWNSCNTWKPC